METRTIAKSNSKNTFSAKRNKEMAYIRNYFTNYVKEHATYRNNSTLYPDYKTHIFTQVIEYTDGMFTLPQLYLIFMANQEDGIGWDYKELSYFKMRVLEEIYETTENEKDTWDINDFSRKIMELNPIIFNVLNELMYHSEMFWDAKDERFYFPDIEEIEAKTERFILKKEEITPEWLITKLTQSWYDSGNGFVIVSYNITDMSLIEAGLSTLSIPFDKEICPTTDGIRVQYNIGNIVVDCLSLYQSMKLEHGECKINFTLHKKPKA